jgi:ATP-dependent helicase/nuclease subunit B
VAKLVAIGQESFGTALARPGVWAFWWPRFIRIAAWVVAQEAQIRPALDAILSEVEGKLALDGPRGRFELTGRADRVERRRDGTIALIDYKTGSAPSGPEVAQGYAPQLPLEAMMIEQGGFGGVAAGVVGELAYWRLTGGDPAGEIKFPQSDPAKLRDLIAAAGQGLADLIAAFDDPATPYRAVPIPGMAPRYSDYAHLERIKEWLSGRDTEE